MTQLYCTKMSETDNEVEVAEDVVSQAHVKPFLRSRKKAMLQIRLEPCSFSQQVMSYGTLLPQQIAYFMVILGSERDTLL